MPDETHAEIMDKVGTAPVLPAQRTSVPTVTTPTCPANCSGRHTVDGFVVCVQCGGTKYKVVLHEWPHSAGHYWTGLEPMHGAPPKRSNEDLVCCNQPMRRVWRS